MKKGKFLIVWALVLTSIAPALASAATINVPAQYPTIGEALENASSGDRVQIAPGTYSEYGLMLTSGVTLVGEGSNPEDTIIDGQSRGRILTAQNLDVLAKIENLTFTNGHAQLDEGYDDSGGAIFVNGANVIISNCRFIRNQAESSGGAIRLMKSTSMLNKCYFEDNRAAKGGGGLDCSYSAYTNVQNAIFIRNSASYGGAFACRGESTPTFYNCRFDQNFTTGNLSHGGAVISFFWGEPTFTNCSFSRNLAGIGGALFADIESPINLTSCTVTANVATSQGSGIYSVNSAPQIKNSIIAFQQGDGVLSLGTENARITCTDIFGNSAGDWIGNIASQANVDGNLSVDPLFCPDDLTTGHSFNLQDESPCAEENGACTDLGAWPVGCENSISTILPLGDFQILWDGGVPTLVWNMDEERRPVGFRVTRSSLENPEVEVEIPHTVDADGVFRATDLGFIPSGNLTHLFMVYVLNDNGTEVLTGVIPFGDIPPYTPLYQLKAYPNPFNPQTNIHFKLGASQKVRVEVYGIDGRKIRTLAHEVFAPGPQSLVWNGQDDNGRVMASGTYVVLVAGKGKPQHLKVMLLK